MAVTLFSGVTGVGLSTICQAVRARVGDEFLLINFGDVMLEQAATHNITSDRQELSALSQRQTQRLQRRAGEYVADKATSNHIILSTHLAVETEAGYIHGLPDSVLRDVAPDTFVLVEADPESIIERRTETDSQTNSVSEREIEFAQQLNRTAAFEYARDRNAHIQFIENENSVNEAVEKTVDILTEE
jgi:adenylate kinase